MRHAGVSMLALACVVSIGCTEGRPAGRPSVSPSATAEPAALVQPGDVVLAAERDGQGDGTSGSFVARTGAVVRFTCAGTGQIAVDVPTAAGPVQECQGMDVLVSVDVPKTTTSQQVRVKAPATIRWRIAVVAAR